MKRFALLIMGILALFTVGLVGAQENTDVVTIEVPNVLVICPTDSVLPSVQEAAQIVFDFRGAEDVLVIPVGVLSEANGVTTITIGRIQLTCDSMVSSFAELSPSASVEVGEVAPQPENIEGVETLTGNYLVVATGAANLRSCPDPTCTQVAIVNWQEFLIPIGSNGAGTSASLWWYVQVGDVYGWIWNELTVVRGDLSGLPVIETEGEPIPPVAAVGAIDVTIFSDQALTAPICVLGQSAQYAIVGRDANTTRLLINGTCADGVTMVQGWINRDLILLRNFGQVFVPIIE